MHLTEPMSPIITVGQQWTGNDMNGNPVYSQYSTTSGGLTKLEHFMLEITKAVIASGRASMYPREIVNFSQKVLEELKKRIEDIESKGLLSDNVTQL